MRVQALLSQPGIEALDVSVLHGPSGLDVLQPDPALFGARDRRKPWLMDTLGIWLARTKKRATRENGSIGARSGHPHRLLA